MTDARVTDPKTAIVCICGSTRFRDEIAAARAKLTLEGEIVVGPEVLVRSDPAYADLHDSDQKVMLDSLHLRKIDLADYVYVVNPGGYIGESTRREIEYALGNGKPVQYLEAPTTWTASDFETRYDEYRTFPFFEDEGGSYIVGLGHRNRAEFAEAVNEYDAYAGADSYGQTEADVAWRYGVPEGSSAEGHTLRWGSDADPVTAETPGAIAITVLWR